MKFKYVNPKAVEEIVGQYAPINAFLFARIIEEALDNANQGYVLTQAGAGRFRHKAPQVTQALRGIADRLLAHNVSGQKQYPWDFYAGLDMDFVHFAVPHSGQAVRTFVNPYFYEAQFARPPDHRRVVFHLVHHDIGGTEWSISIPVQVVMKGFQWIEDGYMGYSHGIGMRGEDGSIKEQHNYIGITKRNWLTRMREHFNEIRSGSNKTFHRAWRSHIGRSDVQLLSELIVVNHNYEQIMDWEEYTVANEMAAGTALNMIPGGFKGMQFLYQHRLTGAPRVSLEEREAALVAYQAQHPRAGIPNLLISELWKDEQYAESVICGAEGRLSADQVRQIRVLESQGMAAGVIAEKVGARNALQVERVLKGETYARIR